MIKTLKQKMVLNNRGQISLFVALVFQVLFVFFAMVVNVGILVHHKINLQNSVDMAAYYGAVKQAEELNMIGHMNYQIRQAWKLLGFRFRQMGTAAYPDNPYNWTNPPGGALNSTIQDIANGQPNPAFCITYSPFVGAPPNQNICKDTSEMFIPQIENTPNLAPFLSINASLMSLVSALQQVQGNDCVWTGTFNWLLLAQFVAGYKIDVGNRKSWIFSLANNLSRSTNDFLEIEGGSARAGVEQTLLRNLTSENRSSVVGMNFYNSLAHPDCGFVAEDQPPKWLTDIEVTPYYSYMDSIWGGGCRYKGKQMAPGSRPNEITANPGSGFVQSVLPLVNYLGQFVDSENTGLMRSSVGVEKNPWCLAYVGVEAQTQPNIPFSPFGRVTLKARAFAKPFGGKIGPWYTKTWTRGSPSSNQDFSNRIDKLWPLRTNSNMPQPPPPEANDPTTWPNHSRYVGDSVGIISGITMGQSARAIRTGGVTPFSGMSLSFQYWDHIYRPFNENVGLDFLAWDGQANATPRLRNVEVAAIVPDEFDITYYSIDPRFDANYLSRFAANKFTPPHAAGFDVTTPRPRPDLGARAGVADLETYSVKSQFELAGLTQAFQYDPPHGLFYFVNRWEHLLTSWVPSKYGNYVVDANRFGKCSEYFENSPFKQPVPGACSSLGGRTGYSVKIINKKFVTSGDSEGQLPYGGDAAGMGGIINPLPAEWN